jgi:hypothetical protein
MWQVLSNVKVLGLGVASPCVLQDQLERAEVIYIVGRGPHRPNLADAANAAPPRPTRSTAQQSMLRRRSGAL